MKFSIATVLTVMVPLASSQCVQHGFRLEGFTQNCTFESLLEIFTPFFDDPVNQGSSCTHTAQEELMVLLGATNLAQAETALQTVCAAGFDSYNNKVPFESIPGHRGSRDFIRRYFNGGTDWNEQYATLYSGNGSAAADDDDGLSYVLQQDANVVERFYKDQARYTMVEWPEYASNFQQCNMNAAYCCWPQDRQANDGNGNCEEPYDVNCIDSDPADNTDLCYVDLGSSTTGFQGAGEFIFQHNDGNGESFGEGPIHCHGFGWTSDPNDVSSVYKANNLFYVAMRDHFYQRGYVREIPGAPMCACAEQMPVVSRADCTEMEVQQSLSFRYEGGSFAMTVEDVEIEFNACQGINRYGQAQNNDLFAFANRLYMQDRLEESALVALGTKLVGDEPSMCREAERRMMAQKGFGTGYTGLQPAGSWFKFAGTHAFSDEIPELGRLSFRNVFESSSTRVIERVCASCVSTHQHAFLRRLTPVPNTLDLRLNLLYSNEQTVGMVWNVDFTIHSTLEDALSGANPWICPSDGYGYEDGFPGNCGPEGPVMHQGALFGWWNARSDVAYYLHGNMNAFVPVDAVAIHGETHGAPAGSAYMNNDQLYLSSGGIDIGSHEDNMHLYYNEHPANVEATVFVQEFHAEADWSKACLVIRESLDAGSRAGSVCVTGNYGILAQQRTETGGWTPHYGEQQGMAPSPVWLRLRKVGPTFTAFTSQDGVTWNQFLESGHIDMTGSNVVVGVAVSSGTWDGRAAEAIFSGFQSNAPSQ